MPATISKTRIPGSIRVPLARISFAPLICAYAVSAWSTIEDASYYDVSFLTITYYSNNIGDPVTCIVLSILTAISGMILMNHRSDGMDPSHGFDNISKLYDGLLFGIWFFMFLAIALIGWFFVLTTFILSGYHGLSLLISMLIVTLPPIIRLFTD